MEVNKSQIESFLSILGGRAILVKVARTDRLVSEDPDDDIVVATAVKREAAYLVSGDNHLLKLGRFKGVEITTVNEMLELIRT